MSWPPCGSCRAPAGPHGRLPHGHAIAQLSHAELPRQSDILARAALHTTASHCPWSYASAAGGRLRPGCIRGCGPIASAPEAAAPCIARRASVLISVTGGAKSLNLDKRLTASFQRGLRAAVRTTKACVVTGGTKSGCMELVGKTLEDEEHLVLLGISPFNKVSEPKP